MASLFFRLARAASKRGACGLAISLGECDQIDVGRSHAEARERLLWQAIFQKAGEQPDHVVFDLGRGHAAQKRLADRSVAPQSAAQDYVKGLQRFAPRAARSFPGARYRRSNAVRRHAGSRQD